MTHDDASLIEIVTSRRMAVPRKKVFEAFTDPLQLAGWWGPVGFTNTIQIFDLRPGGMWQHVMRSPEGVEFDNESQFVEVTPHERIVFEHLRPIHWFRMTMLFADVGGATELTWRMELAADEESRKLKDFLAAANEQNFDRLEQHLATVA
jgi:uncharacterized protein YndB with AHSA1/START domain